MANNQFPRPDEVSVRATKENKKIRTRFTNRLKKKLEKKLKLKLRVRAIPSVNLNTWIEIWIDAPIDEYFKQKIPNKFRRKVLQIARPEAQPLDWNDINYGNIQKQGITLHYSDWLLVYRTL